MSENLELVRSIYADWERGDFSRNDWANPEIKLRDRRWAEPGDWTGFTEMARRYGDWLRGWRTFVLRRRSIPRRRRPAGTRARKNSGRAGCQTEIERHRSVANLFAIGVER